MTVYHTILKRRTIRKYSNKEVSQEKIEQLLREAQWQHQAPTIKTLAILCRKK